MKIKVLIEVDGKMEILKTIDIDTSIPQVASEPVAAPVSEPVIQPKPVIEPSTQPTPMPPNVKYLDKIAPKSGDRYGLDDVSMGAGSTTTYCLPVGKLYTKDYIRLLINTCSLGVVAGGDIALKLTSPEGRVFMQDFATTSDESINVMAGVNYPMSKITKGDWILEITAKVDSRFRIWWYLPY